MNPPVRPSSSTTNPVASLRDYGQSVWLDFIRRSLITSGELKRYVDEDGLGGVTSNPAIFEKAIGGSDDYKTALAELATDHTLSPKDMFERLAIKDIQEATDVLRVVYDRTNGADGFVSLEVAPDLARDTLGTLAEARRLWRAVDRPNVMIKVPATPEGVPAIKQLLTEGININITLLFARSAYEAVAWAYVEALEARIAKGQPVDRVASVASFFVSRIDTLVDSKLTEKLKTASAADKPALEALFGKTAIANAKLAYASYKTIFSGPRWEAIAAKGAHTQRVLWASTSVKNPAYRDTMYVEELIGRDTVNTVPPETITAFRDHGRLRASLEEDLPAATATLAALAKMGISLDAVTSELLDDGLKKFVDPFTKLLAAVERRATEVNAPKLNRQRYTLAPELAAAVTTEVAAWQARGGTKPLWSGDAGRWTSADEASWLGWIPIVEQQIANLGALQEVREDAGTGSFTHALLLGMGGSSLCPEVWRETFGRVPGSPELFVLDSTDPAQVKLMEQRVDLARTLFIVSSKSGSTLEPNIFKAYFLDRATQALKPGKAADHFIAITDPGSDLEKQAKAEGFRQIFAGVKSIGGRYSALSNFGMVPAAVMGLNIEHLLVEADRMMRACGPAVPAAENPGLMLGVILGVLANKGIDKLTFVTSPGIHDLGAWLEQLIAESTGKNGKGIIPVDRERTAGPDQYGDDRLFAYLRLGEAPDAEQDAAIAALEKAGKPVVRIDVAARLDLAEEFVRWEIATAVAGAIIGINPFDQPDVEVSKVATRALTSAYEKSGSLPAEEPFFEAGGVKLFADPKNADALRAAAKSPSLEGYLKAHLDRLTHGDYFGLLAYVSMTADHERVLQAARHRVRDARRVATCLGFGPRFLHSTGQGYKGGPNTGVFLQVTCDDAEDLKVPGSKFTFGIVKAAQARGDFQVLADRGRRALRVHLGADVAAGLRALDLAIDRALGH
jgi:transaldolase/glucose-6-phosphate isomerase